MCCSPTATSNGIPKQTPNRCSSRSRPACVRSAPCPKPGPRITHARDLKERVMIQVIPSAQRHHTDAGWLSTYWHFSFSDYYDPNNMNWGDLRVFNDDVIQGGGGFGMHPHRDMEIV